VVWKYGLGILADIDELQCRVGGGLGVLPN
jgi:hypothetical protein